MLPPFFTNRNWAVFLMDNMAIYLDEQTRQSLKQLTTSWLSEHPNDWKVQRLLVKLEEDNQRLEKMANCQHENARYIGEKTCCGKCESFYEPGMDESWSRVNNGVEQSEMSSQPTAPLSDRGRNKQFPVPVSDR
jgi:hypothetical protein